jgi:hypothetical protein
MNKTELKKYVGSFGCIVGKTRRHGMTEDMTLYGTLEMVEDKNVLFKDNYNHIHIFNMVKSFTPGEFIKGC